MGEWERRQDGLSSSSGWWEVVHCGRQRDVFVLGVYCGSFPLFSAVLFCTRAVDVFVDHGEERKGRCDAAVGIRRCVPYSCTDSQLVSQLVNQHS